MFAPALPKMKLIPQIISLRGGIDLVTASMFATPGTLDFARNYEALPLGGYERVGGIERFSGQPRPSDATYQVIAPATTFSGAVVGDTINGQTSGATGVLIAITTGGAYIVTKVVGSFARLENIRKVTTVLGIYAALDPVTLSTDDNTYNALAAANYRADIAAVPGAGPVRGVAIVNDVNYAWRNNAGQTALVCYKSTTAGWVLVPLFREISFTSGSVQYTDGSTLTQGTVSATIQRVVLESGNWTGGNAAGRFIITTPAGGALVFAAGASTGGGVATLSGADTAIAMLPGGRIESDLYNFTGSATAAFTRLYACDGINREFEFDGTTMVPINTGMNTIRASFVKCHKFQLLFAYQGSLQVSGPGTPYVWSPILGAGELGTGDTITGFVPVGGSEASSALMVFCKKTTWVLYGNATYDFRMSRISEKSGANPYSCQDLGFPLVHDAPGLRRYFPQKEYGNFGYELASLSIEALVKGLVPRCSVVAVGKSRYRCFFTDGTSIVGTPLFSGTNSYTGLPIYSVKWMACDLARNIYVAVEGKIAGISRVFYGDDLGFVYEADVGRSFDGDTISAAIRMQNLNQSSTLQIKQYRRFDIEAVGQSAFTLGCGFEFNDGDPDVATNVIVPITALANAGQALVYDGANWDQAYWGVGETARKRISCSGQGYAITPIMSSSSAVELPHRLMAVAILYSPLRYSR